MGLSENEKRFILAQVTTIPEVCAGWQKDRKTVLVRVWKGDIFAVKVGGMWVLLLSDVVDLWGFPSQEVSRG